MRTLLFLIFTLCAGVASASTIRIDFTPQTSGAISGFVVWDTVNFNGSSFVLISNTDILQLSLTDGSDTWDTGDISATGAVFFDDSGALPKIVEALAFLADSPGLLIRTTDPSGGNVLFEKIIGGTLTPIGASSQSTSVVPLPASIPLLLTGFVGLAGMRIRRKNRPA